MSSDVANGKISREAEYCFNIHTFSIYVVPQLRRVLGAKDTISVLTSFWQRDRTAGSPELLQFGLTDLNLILNEKLNRPADHPTFGRMVEYALKDVIQKDPYCKDLRNTKGEVSAS